MKTEDEFKAEVQDLLVQFGQAILYGPPGTGKTRLARGVAAKILRLASVDELEGEKERFQFVQFHPSYNYEDFVRGIRMETDDNGRVAYKTENRVFGEMAERAAEAAEAAKAAKSEPPPYVLVIDEINRANVSAVLGELIYGLEMEYRGNKVQTPYEVDGGYGLTVPSNLKVIGTMNTADRTIGQIDYAVRRRFAFVQCLPDESVVSDSSARGFFKMVDDVFVHLSADHDKEDVCIGHSYFLASGPELANKIIYQVVPILREYLKDGVLGKEAEAEIDKIEREARKLEKPVRVEGADERQEEIWVLVDGSARARIKKQRWGRGWLILAGATIWEAEGRSARSPGVQVGATRDDLKMRGIIKPDPDNKLLLKFMRDAPGPYPLSRVGGIFRGTNLNEEETRKMMHRERQTNPK